jgi:hypothetical protein
MNLEAKRKLKLERKYITYERSRNEEDLSKLAVKTIYADILSKAVKKKAVKVGFSKEAVAKTSDEYIFVTSDFHYSGQEEMLGVFNQVYSHILAKQKEHGFKKIKLFELGDTIDGGSLRTSQLMAIKKGMVFQIIDVSKVYAEMLQNLSKKMEVEFYCVTSSNHTQLRPLGTNRNELVEEDLMHVFHTYIAESLKNNKRVKVQGADDFIVPITEQHKMFVAHGHLIGGKKEGYLQEVAYHRGVQFDYGLFGHFHHYREVTLYKGKGCNKKVFFAPSMSTESSTYENDNNMSSHPGMLMMVFSKEKGHRYSEELFVE